MARNRRILLILLILILGIGVDQWTKQAAQDHLPKKKSLYYAGDTIRLDYNENKGGVLSFEEALPASWQGRRVSLAVAGGLGLLALLLLAVPSVRPLPVVGLSLLLSGGISNLYDRVSLGRVIDFLNVGIGCYRSSIFNVADVAISAGAVLWGIGCAWFLWRWARGIRQPD